MYYKTQSLAELTFTVPYYYSYKPSVMFKPFSAPGLCVKTRAIILISKLYYLPMVVQNRWSQTFPGAVIAHQTIFFPIITGLRQALPYPLVTWHASLTFSPMLQSQCCVALNYLKKEWNHDPPRKSNNRDLPTRLGRLAHCYYEFNVFMRQITAPHQPCGLSSACVSMSSFCLGYIYYCEMLSTQPSELALKILKQ